MKSRFRSLGCGVALALAVTDGAMGQPADTLRSAALADVDYQVTFDRQTARSRSIGVEMSFRTSGSEPVLLSLPAWTPGSYELDNYARNVQNFSARAGGEALRWDKVDYDTWRVRPLGAGEVTVSFDYRADSLDTGNSWATPDFAYFNGTNLFLYPEGRGLAFDSRVSIRTEPGWRVATGMTPGAGPNEYVAADFHEVVDMPTFIGRFDVDSAVIDGVLHRLATYPEGLVAGDPRATIWEQLRGMMPAMAEVFDETPFDTYTTLMVFPERFGGASALEHRNSHLGIYVRQALDNPFLASVVAHEIFHAWNVKRLRPAELVPYDYGRPQLTTLLWVSEGITSYYDDLSLVRGGVFEPEFFYEQTSGDIEATESAGAVALEDASLSTWIGPRDGTDHIYYPKGAVAGFLLDILIRDATDNEASLDDVMRDLYWRTHKEKFTGFSEAAWWESVRRAGGGESFDDFYARYVDGREPYPWDDVLPLAGLKLVTDTTYRPLVGIYPEYDDRGARVSDLVPDGAAATAGVQAGDYLVRAGPVEIDDEASFDEFRAHFAEKPEGTPYGVVVLRGGEEVMLELELRISEQIERSLVEDPDASHRAIQIRESLLRGG
jgi:predicted metalloprotease with PDZ domain